MDGEPLETMGQTDTRSKMRRSKMRTIPQKYLVKVNGKYLYDPILWYDHKVVQYVPLENVVETPEEPTEIIGDFSDIEFIISRLSALEVELMVLRHLGFNSKEITKIMNFKDRYWYYRLSSKLRKNALKLINS